MECPYISISKRLHRRKQRQQRKTRQEETNGGNVRVPEIV
jgi:hypothetical protein